MTAVIVKPAVECSVATTPARCNDKLDEMGENMKMKYLFNLITVLIFSGNAFATNIIKLPLGTNVGADVTFDGTEFRTLDDGNGLTTGDQNTRILFVGFGGAFSDLNTETASFSITDVMAFGPALTVAGVIAQGTTGGTFNLWAPDNTLLISGILSTGALSGSEPGGTGSFFNTQLGTFTGGALLNYLSGNTADLSLALNSVTTGGLQGMRVTGTTLEPFISDASVLVQGSQVPEPTAMMLLLSGLTAIGMRKKRV